MTALAAIAVALLAFACAAPTPRFEGQAAEPAEEEKQLWKVSGEIEAAVAESAIVVKDDKLLAYLRGVVARLLTACGASGQPVRVHVVRDPFLNAMVLPNGVIYVHTGMLAQLENEAQLATVLGHELEHYLGRHALRELRDARRESILRAQRSGFARNLEREADAAAAATLARAGYDAREAPRVYELFLEEEAEAGVLEPYYYGDHPATVERRKSAMAQVEGLRKAGALPAGGVVGKEAYDAAVADVLLINSAYDLDLRRFVRARAAVDRHLKLKPDSAAGYLALGEVLRRQAGGDRARLVAAGDAYRRAVELDGGLADAARELGLFYRVQGRGEEGQRYLRRYLELSPKAADRAIIESYLR